MDVIAMPFALFGFVMSLCAMTYIGKMDKRIKELEAKLANTQPTINT